MIGYLDIETSIAGEVTVVGIYRADRGLVQLAGAGVTPEAVNTHLNGLDTICTYNGEGFDLPILDRQLGTDLQFRFRSVDLLQRCRRRRLRGGFKAVEATLQISRDNLGLNGSDAMDLWERWLQGDRTCLVTLLDYNRDDVLNLVLLERRLAGDLTDLPDVHREVVGV